MKYVLLREAASSSLCLKLVVAGRTVLGEYREGFKEGHSLDHL